MPEPKKFLDQVCDAICLKQYSARTERTYVLWVRSSILFHNKRHPKGMGIPEIRPFIAHLVSEKRLSASSQNQALSTIKCIYRHVLFIKLDETGL
jgi:site-specific recombinase XerD